MRLTLFGGRLEVNTTRYKNFSPNARISPAPAVAILDEATAIFGTGFNRAGTDYQTLNTTGWEVEVVANFTRNWRLMLNGATNELAITNRLPQLKAFQAAAKAQSKATPLLDAFLLTFPEGVPSAGYTKARANVFTRYDFTQGRSRVSMSEAAPTGVDRPSAATPSPCRAVRCNRSGRRPTPS